MVIGELNTRSRLDQKAQKLRSKSVSKLIKKSTGKFRKESNNHGAYWSFLLVASAGAMIALCFPECMVFIKRILVDETRTEGEQQHVSNDEPVKQHSSNNDELNNYSKTKTKSKPEPENDLPDEIKQYKSIYQRSIKTKKQFIDGRRIAPVELIPQKEINVSNSVRIFLLDDFLSEAECDGLRAVHDKHIKEQSEEPPHLCFEDLATLRQHLQNAGKIDVTVTQNDFLQGTRCLNATLSQQLGDWMHHNWSYSTAFYPGESKFSTKLEEMIFQTTGLQKSNGGKFQITSYPLNVGYKAHTDCIENNPDKRDRMGTILIYLDTVAEGGETEFSELGIWVKPKKGRALVWNNMNDKGKCEPMSIHHARKVISGQKYILQRWYYYKSFYSLGRRPTPPSLPPRNANQAMVSCDEYAFGSCRWYDEWNYDNIDEYRRQKVTLI